VRAYERVEFAFSPSPDRGVLVDGSGAEWRVTEDALSGPGGRRMDRIPGHLFYWFGWFSFFPSTFVYEE
jgi:hypothetical protein